VRKTNDPPRLWRLSDGRRTLAAYEATENIEKGQVRAIGGRNIRVQAKFIAGPSQIAAWEWRAEFSRRYESSLR
jgi:hypothetical protein